MSRSTQPRSIQRRPPRLRLALAIAGAALASTACLQFTDTVAFENRTESALLLHTVLEGGFVRYNCAGDGSDRAEVEGEIDSEIPAGGRICFEGPAVSPESPYDARDRIDLVEIRRDNAVCVTLEGDDLYAAFGADQVSKVLPIDDARCPAP